MSSSDEEKLLNIKPYEGSDNEDDKEDKQPITELIPNQREDNLEVQEVENVIKQEPIPTKQIKKKQKDPKKQEAGRKGGRKRADEKKRLLEENKRLREENERLSRLEDNITNRLFEKMNSLKPKPEPKPTTTESITSHIQKRKKIVKPIKMPESVIQPIKMPEPIYEEPIVKQETALERRKRLRELIRR